MGLGEIDRAEALLRQSLRLLQEQDARWDLATAWHWFGLVAYTRGDRQEATIRLRRARALYAQVDDPDFAIWKRGNLAWLALLQGDLATARELYAAAVADAWQTRDDPRLAWPLMGVGGVAALQGQAVQAARLYGAAEALRAASEGQLRPSMRMIYANLAADCRSTIGEAAWMAAFGAGQSLPPKQIVAEALAVLTVAPAADAARSSVAPGSIDSDPSPGETDAGATLPSGSRLTRRQRDVLRLLVAGNSDREIAAALSISYRTATFHVANILAKLDVPSRTAAVAFALEQHLLEAHDPRRTTPLPPSR
ncbi:MAG TPA: LuxR C-terminal-related transcriptional regulator [Thermomicrobiales bacterium]|nr:LuxR C-terminal-related transcriptional regulator [Thermomicrobiales bacterium]